MQGVLFDVDDTLVDHGGARETAIRCYLASLGLHHEDAAVRRWCDAEDRQFAGHLTGELTFQGQRRARVRDMLSAAGLDDATADAWFAGYTEHFEAAWAAYDDVVAALDRLDHDALGARDAGLRAVWLDRHGPVDARWDNEAPDGVTRITSLYELDRVLA